jgi:hypothetical protein
MYTSKIIAVAAAALLLTGCEKAMTQGGPPYPGPTEDVRLSWIQGQNEWMVHLNNGAAQHPKNAKTIIPQGADPTMFVVEISGHPNATFKNPGGLTVWEGVGAKSLPQPGINSDQIIGPIVTEKGRKLVFFDLNTTQVTLNYALHFNNGIPTVDPIIENNP